jgi:hypothetical protein
MKIVTAVLPLVLALYLAVRDGLLMWSGKATFSWSPLLIDGLWLSLAGAWAVLVLRMSHTRKRVGS